MSLTILRKPGGRSSALVICCAALGSVTPEPAWASDWGCQVALCLATPGSPITYPACVQPITRLWDTLVFGGSFPTCTEGGVDTSTQKISDGYRLTVTTPDGSVSRYTVNTKTQTITNNTPATGR